MKEKIIEMLGNGISPAIISRAVGCSDSYISQLMSDENIRQQVSTERVGQITRSQMMDRDMDEIEEQSLIRMKALLPFISHPMDAVRIFQAVNQGKRHMADTLGIQTPTAPLVQINISQAAAVQFKLSADQQVVEVDGRSMTTLPSRTLNEQLKNRAAARPLISDSMSAASLLKGIEEGIPEDSIAHVL